MLIAIRYYTSTKPYAHSTFCTCVATKPKKKVLKIVQKNQKLTAKAFFPYASFMFSYDLSCCGRTARELSFFPKIFSSKPLIPHFLSTLSLPSTDGGITHVQSNCASWNGRLSHQKKNQKKQNWVLTKPRSSFAGSAPFLQPFYKCWCISVNRLSFVPSQNQTDILFCAICFIKVKHWHKSANIKLRSAGWKGS